VQVHASYLELARNVLACEKQWLGTWTETCPGLAAQYLRQPILVDSQEAGGWLLGVRGQLLSSCLACSTRLRGGQVDVGVGAEPAGQLASDGGATLSAWRHALRSSSWPQCSSRAAAAPCAPQAASS